MPRREAEARKTSSVRGSRKPRITIIPRIRAMVRAAITRRSSGQTRWVLVAAWPCATRIPRSVADRGRSGFAITIRRGTSSANDLTEGFSRA